jgi:hypothetical protein
VASGAAALPTTVSLHCRLSRPDYLQLSQSRPDCSAVPFSVQVGPARNRGRCYLALLSDSGLRPYCRTPWAATTHLAVPLHESLAASRLSLWPKPRPRRACDLVAGRRSEQRPNCRSTGGSILIGTQPSSLWLTALPLRAVEHCRLIVCSSTSTSADNGLSEVAATTTLFRDHTPERKGHNRDTIPASFNPTARPCRCALRRTFVLLAARYSFSEHPGARLVLTPPTSPAIVVRECRQGGAQALSGC